MRVNQFRRRGSGADASGRCGKQGHKLVIVCKHDNFGAAFIHCKKYCYMIPALRSNAKLLVKNILAVFFKNLCIVGIAFIEDGAEEHGRQDGVGNQLFHGGDDQGVD